ncbi:flavin reductase family protein [Streptomyces sp. NPDC052052]|uniref:flavin reductase family protein n=1 Tax=Streptomyces sp. NPDC052052 TaxID=3154756 RepID=UPI00341B3C3F
MTGHRPVLVESALFRSVFRRHAAGVTIVTAQGAHPVGFTATSLASLSVNPPLLTFGISATASSWPVVNAARHVGVHFLGEEQETLAATFARSGVDRFAAPASWHQGPEGVPVLDGVLALLICRVVSRVAAGDHTLVIAEPVHAQQGKEGQPLLYHDGGYATLRT